MGAAGLPSRLGLDERIHEQAAKLALLRGRIIGGSEFERALALRDLQTAETEIRNVAHQVGQLLALIVSLGDGDTPPSRPSPSAGRAG